MEAIKTFNLTKKYKDIVAVDNLNLTINKGELFSLLGINGAGKTTTIKMLSCLTKPSKGDAFIEGNSIITQQDKIKKIIGISPQENAIAPNLTVRENLELMCGIYNIEKEKIKEKILNFSELFKLTEVLNKKASKLSGGFKRRVSIAMALIADPKILFLDEPSLGLDVIARSELWDIILNLKGKTTIILTTHYMEEAEILSDRIAIMKHGKMLIVDTIEGIKKSTNTTKIEDAFIKIVKEN